MWDDDGLCDRYDHNCDDTVRWTVDPYASEIHGDETEMWLCDYHYYESCAEI